MKVENKYGIKKFIVCKMEDGAEPVFFDSEILAAEYCLRINCDVFFEIDDTNITDSDSLAQVSVKPQKVYFVDGENFKLDVFNFDEFFAMTRDILGNENCMCSECRSFFKKQLH
ncbi:hypothetical protein [Arsenophonus nasoniae]|uniref:Uncharacterized protein n=1 Tax=Arsenophonus nasoniae TaxID=638 RepID=A0AA95H107_9GAMM|nr:hypothetical protein [Arsenophonus nasoniae]WGM04112.1 hypothetical protein QE210_21890 [Arsenophonus nasoniae]